MGLYRQIDGQWEYAEVSIATPKLVIDKDNLAEGWEYFEAPPKEYLAWVEAQEKLNEI